MGRKTVNKAYYTVLGGLGAAACVSVSSFAYHYTVKRGDTLSEIAAQNIPGPVYGKTGSLAQLLKKNPQINTPNFIMEGQKLSFHEDLIVSKNSELSSDTIKIRGAAEIEHKRVVSQTNMKHRHKLRESLIFDQEHLHQRDKLMGEATKKARSPAAIEIDPETPQSLMTSDPFQPYGKLSLGSDFYSTRLQATDTSDNSKATLLSKANYAINLAYSQIWSDRFATDFFFSRRDISFQIPSDQSSLDTNKATLYAFGAQARLGLNQRLDLNLGLLSEQVPYFRGTSSSSSTIDSLSVFSLSSGLGYHWLQIGAFSIYNELGGAVSLPRNSGTFESKWNPRLYGTIGIKQAVTDSWQIETGLKMNYSVQNSSIADQNEIDLGIFFNAHFSLGKAK